MNIKKTKTGILLKGKQNSVLITDDPENAKAADKADLVFSAIESSEYAISRPGEYEINDILVYALDPTGIGRVTLWAVDIDDIKIVYISNKLDKVSKKALDEVGINQVLIWDLVDADVKKQAEFVFEFDPHIFVPIMGKEEKFETLSKELGTKINGPETSINVKATDFAEEPQLEVITLK